MDVPAAAPADPDDALARVLELLARFHVLTLACRDAEGSWAAAVFFASEGLDLYFVSSPDSRHARSLSFDARLAGEIHGPADDWRSIVGLQLSGEVQRLAQAEVPGARRCYGARFPFVDSGQGTADRELDRALAKAAWYRLRIDEAVLIDNTRGLGQRLRWAAPAR